MIKRSFILIVLLFFSCGCREEVPPPAPKQNPPPPEPPLSVRFTDITKEAGVAFVHNNGARGKKYLPESMGSGCAFLDYNGDGYQDILLINSMDWPAKSRAKSLPALYENNRDGTFKDVTSRAGLAVEMYGLGTAIADYDNDGDADIYITCLGPDRFFRNNGNGTFSEVTKESRLDNSGFATSALWFDYDKDQNLDLYVCNYVEWSEEKDLFCTLDGTNKSYCTPESYQGASSRLYRNKGDGTFEDVTRAAGLFDPTSKALGVAMVDYDMDGWPDLYVANDTEPNKLYRNNGNGTFTERGVAAGVAFSETGAARAGMGVDAADYDDSGKPSLLVGNFSNEMIALYHNEGNGLFIDDAPASAIGPASLLTLTFGAFFFDFDLDGLFDVFAANGHVHDDIEKVQQQVTYAQKPQLFWNRNGEQFKEVTDRVGFLKPLVARGAAYGDIENDGDLDVLISSNSGPAYLYRNDGGKNRFLKFRTIGTKSNRDGIGAKIVVHLKDGKQKWQIVKTGSSYCSQSELPATFGLGPSGDVSYVEVFWPGGTVQRLQNIPPNQLVVIKEE